MGVVGYEYRFCYSLSWWVWLVINSYLHSSHVETEVNGSALYNTYYIQMELDSFYSLFR